MEFCFSWVSYLIGKMKMGGSGARVGVAGEVKKWGWDVLFMCLLFKAR